MSSRGGAGGKKRQRHSRGGGSVAVAGGQSTEVGLDGGSGSGGGAIEHEEQLSIITPTATDATSDAPMADDAPPGSQTQSPVAPRAAKQRKLAHADGSAGEEAVVSAVVPTDTVPAPTVALDAESLEPTASPLPAAHSPARIASPAVSPAGSPTATASPSAAATATATASPTASAVGSSVLPPLPAGMNRGYVAQFYWGTHSAHVTDAASLPVFSEVVASIPAIFHQIVTILAAAEHTASGRDILLELDKKIIKALTPKEVDLVPTLDRKLIIRSLTPGSTQDYMIHACRKEHVRLIFASAEDGGVLGKLGMCPLLIDLFLVMPQGKRTLAGGSGGYRYGPNVGAGAGAVGVGSKRGSGGASAAASGVPEKGFDYRCTCGHAGGETVPATEEVTAPVAAPSTPIKAEPETASPPVVTPQPSASPSRKVKEESKASPSPLAMPAAASAAEDTDMADVTPEPLPLHTTSPNSTSPTLSMLTPAAAAAVAGVIHRRAPGSGAGGDKTQAAFRSPPSSGSNSHAHGHAHSSIESSSNCLHCQNWQKKHAKQSKIIEKMRLELVAVHEERGLWEQKWSDERDHNIRLWEKTMLIQKQLRDMSRPLGVSLTHAMNHISTTAAASAQQQQQAAHQQQQHQHQQQLQQQHQQQLAAAPLIQQSMLAPPPPHGFAYDANGVLVGVGPTGGLVAVDPYGQVGPPGTAPLTDHQLQQHLHPSEMQAAYPSNIQNQLANARMQQAIMQP